MELTRFDLRNQALLERIAVALEKIATPLVRHHDKGEGLALLRSLVERQEALEAEWYSVKYLLPVSGEQKDAIADGLMMATGRLRLAFDVARKTAVEEIT